MPDDAKQAWSEVGAKFSSFGRSVADRYREVEAEPSDRSTESDLRRAATELIDELSRGFSAIGATLRDEQAKQDLSNAVTAIGDAITATVNEATQGLRSGSSTAKSNEAPPDEDGGSSAST
jgi:hypothetical protein